MYLYVLFLASHVATRRGRWAPGLATIYWIGLAGYSVGDTHVRGCQHCDVPLSPIASPWIIPGARS